MTREDETEIASPEHQQDAGNGTFRWGAGDRDSVNFGEFSGKLTPTAQLETLLKMEGLNGRSDEEVKKHTGRELSRARRWHKIFERMGVFYPGGEVTRLGRLGRMLKDATEPNGLERLIAREAANLLMRYQLDNPVERAAPQGVDVHPYYLILAAASRLDWKIHWDEVNRELMHLRSDDQLDVAVARIAAARVDPNYGAFIGRSSNEAGLLSARAHGAEATAPDNKTPEGQLRDQKLTPWLKRAGFGEMLLEAGGTGGGGYWTVPQDKRDIVGAAVSVPPVYKHFSSVPDWIAWFCEGVITPGDEKQVENVPPPPPPPPPAVKLEISNLSLAVLKEAIATYDPDLEYSDALLASVVAALRAGDGRNFIVLRGVSGTGKTRLVTAIARAIYGAAVVPQPYLTIVEVRPDWTDGSYLLGHYDPISQHYVRPKFLNAMLAADSALATFGPVAPVLVCLDEMNLARVEFYLSDCLSAMESGSPMELETRGDSGLPTALRWPPTLYLFGTINIDESTMRISDKVLDRAQVIDTSDIMIQPALERWLAESNALDIAEIISGAWNLLNMAGMPFGFRVAKAIVRFVDEAKASSGGALSIDDAIDAQLIQKVLVKLRGEGEHWRKPLDDLSKLLGGLSGAQRSYQAVKRMQGDLDRLGSFEFWN